MNTDTKPQVNTTVMRGAGRKFGRAAGSKSFIGSLAIFTQVNSRTIFHWAKSGVVHSSETRKDCPPFTHFQLLKENRHEDRPED